MPYELVIFDCDGVLVDSERVAVGIDAQVITALGWPITEAEVVERFVGRSHGYMVQEIEARLGARLPDGWEDRFRQIYLDALEDLEPVDGIIEALDRISIPTCVASSGSHAKMRRTLGQVGLYERFAGRIYSASEVANGKPAPDLFLHAAEQMGAQPARCAVVEDSVFGVEAGLAAGMDVYAFSGGVIPAHRLERKDVVVFDDMSRLPALLSKPRPNRPSAHES